VDVSIPFSRYFQTRCPLIIGGECKQHGRRVNIKMVDSFRGMLEDAGLSLGIMVAELGFTKGAKDRAAKAGIVLLRFPWELKALIDNKGKEYEDICDHCPGADNAHPPGMIYWRLCGGDSNEFGYAVGQCQTCGTHFSLCFDCWEKTGFLEGDYDKGIECSGGCGAVFIASYVYDDDAIGDIRIKSFNSLEVEILKACYKSRRGLTDKRVSKIIDGTKWKYWTVGDPLIFIREEGLLELTSSGLMKLTSDGEQMVKDYLEEPIESSYTY